MACTICFFQTINRSYLLLLVILHRKLHTSQADLFGGPTSSLKQCYIKSLVDEVMSRGEASPASADDNHLLWLRGFMGRGELGPEKGTATGANGEGSSREASGTTTAGSWTWGPHLSVPTGGKPHHFFLWFSLLLYFFSLFLIIFLLNPHRAGPIGHQEPSQAKPSPAQPSGSSTLVSCKQANYQSITLLLFSSLLSLLLKHKPMIWWYESNP